MDHRGAVTFDFFCCACKYIPATVTCILKCCKYQGKLPSEQQQGALVCLLYPPVLYQSIHTFSLEVLWGRGILLILACCIWCQYSGSIFSSNLYSHIGFQIKIYGRYGGSTSLEFKMMCLYLLLSEDNWLKNLQPRH